MGIVSSLFLRWRTLKILRHYKPGAGLPRANGMRARLLLPIVSYCRQIGMHVRTEVAQADQGLAAGVFDFYAGRGGLVRDEHFVLGLLAEADHGRGLQLELADAAPALHRDPAACAGIIEFAPGPRFD